jgi:hypothetical protein
MDVDVITTRVDTTWQDATRHWKDEYASRFRTAVISELENILGKIRNTTVQLSEATEDALSALQEFNN